MSRFKSIGKLAAGIGLGSGTLALIGGAGLVGAGSSMRGNKERKTPIVDALLEGVIGIPQVDRMLIGGDVGISDLLPIPGGDVGSVFGFGPTPNTLRNFRLINPKTFGDIRKSVDFTQTQAISNLDNGYTNQPFSTSSLPYRSSSARRNFNATGDVVFGMYNSRQGR